MSSPSPPKLAAGELTAAFLSVAGKGEKVHGGAYPSKAEIRKSMRRARNGPGRNQSGGGRVDSLKGFNPDSFDRVLLDAPCSALGLRPRLFAG
ncbi:methyltransferase NSUN6-like protein [Trifolium pratense]|uniref:Methyltransferase NSUN6-like protein n=1 Tax=Trifolium pratense TaxID=57577 RepID=A0A2K3NKK3_TRIPR|nr:methyltransferase NSUN6-like protein [Trifolium pratense]